MDVAAGEYEIGPGTGRLVVRTFREGAAARVGHDLLLEAADWQGRVVVPARDDGDSAVSVSARVDLRTLRVVAGSGGVKPLSDGDRQQILGNMRKALRTDRHPYASFTSTRVERRGDGAVVEGELELAGQVRPVRLEVARQDEGSVIGSAVVVQSQWGIKPYSGFFGALRVRDAVDVECVVTLPED